MQMEAAKKAAMELNMAALLAQKAHEDAEHEVARLPGMVRDKSDWSENGEIKVKHQMQSEYWTITYYSLLISMVSFLVTNVWIDRTSALERLAEVTVEPEGLSEPGSLEPADGSFFAIVDVGSTAVGGEVIMVDAD